MSRATSGTRAGEWLHSTVRVEGDLSVTEIIDMRFKRCKHLHPTTITTASRTAYFSQKKAPCVRMKHPNVRKLTPALGVTT